MNYVKLNGTAAMGRAATLLTAYLAVLISLISHCHSLPDLKIFEVEPSTKTIPYVKGVNLTCYAKSSHDVYWKWLKDGDDETNRIGSGYDIADDSVHLDRQSSRIWLKSTDELENNYTCVAYNALREVVRHTFTVSKIINATIIKTGGEEWVLIATLSTVAILIVIIIFGLICFKMTPKRPSFDSEEIRRFFGGKIKYAVGMGLLEPDDYSDLSYDMSKEIEISSLIIGRLVGKGQFGQVHAAVLVSNDKKGPHRQVVVKRPIWKAKMSDQDIDSAFRDFIHKEIKLSQLVGTHPFIVGYVGAVTKDIAQYKAYLVLEYCSGGNLLDYLRKYPRCFQDDIQSSSSAIPKNAGLKTSHLLKWAEQIAEGLEYLGSKLVPHMDLAARNILLAHQDPALNTEEHVNPKPADLIAKISDFGMARRLNSSSDSYVIFIHTEQDKNKKRYLPLKWMSLEALESLESLEWTSLEFTLKNDIWALGVLYWEMFTLGAIPYYPGLKGDFKTQAKQLIGHFRAGHTLPRPNYASSEVWEIMVGTWNHDPSLRPSPQKIIEKLRYINTELQNRLRQAVEDKLQTSSVASSSKLGPYSSFEILEGPITEI